MRKFIQRLAIVLTMFLSGAMHSLPAVAQTDYYKLDKDRPTRVEGAFAKEHYAFVFQAVPLALRGQADGSTVYRPEIEFGYGLFPGFDVEVGASLPLSPLTDAVAAGDPEFEASARLNLTVETRFLPAIAVRATAHAVPALDDPWSYELKAIATRSVFSYVRLHVNGAVGLGEGRHEDWWAGAAIDYAFPFHGVLLVASGYAARMNDAHFGPLADDIRWHSDAGVRYQISPRLSLDAGIGRSWTGPGGDEWRLALGIAHEFGIRALMPPRRR
jgi:hypothetical protein